jgi:hypothetical protein
MVAWFGNDLYTVKRLAVFLETGKSLAFFYSVDKCDLLLQGLLCVLLLQDIPGAGGEAEGVAPGRGRGLLPQSYPPLYHRSGYKLQATE